MNLDRLNHLKTVMQGVHDSQQGFNLGSWIENSEAKDLSLYSNIDNVGNVENTCGTTCCAMGYAALDPEFRAQGLKLFLTLDYKENLEVESIEDFNMRMKLSKVTDAHPIFDGSHDFGGSIKFFGITSGAADYLFDPTYYDNSPTPLDVISRVDEVIANYGDAPHRLGWLGDDD